MKYLFYVFIFSSLLLFQACSETIEVKSLVSISDNNDNEKILLASKSTQLECTAHYSDGSTKNITNELIWSSSDTDFATVEAGLITTNSNEGNVTISYETVDELESGEPIFKKSINYEIKGGVLESISIVVQNITIYIGGDYTLSAIGNYEINISVDITKDITSDCNWSSSNETIATVSNDGVITGISAGEVTITIKEPTSDIKADINITVEAPSYNSIEILAPSNYFNVGETLQFQALGKTENNLTIDITEKVDWVSSDETIVTIDTNGLAQAKAISDVNITANYDSIDSSLYSLEVYKDEYMQLFRGEDKLDFPYFCYENTRCLKFIDNNGTYNDLTFESFSIKAVGKEFKITNIEITDFNGTTVAGASFDNLDENQTIAAEETVEFSLKLVSDSEQKELRYSFSVDNENIPSFVATYILE